MEKAEIRSVYLLSGFLIFAYALPFVVGVLTGNVLFDVQWLYDLTTVALSTRSPGGDTAPTAPPSTRSSGLRPQGTRAGRTAQPALRRNRQELVGRRGPDEQNVGRQRRYSRVRKRSDAYDQAEGRTTHA